MNSSNNNKSNNNISSATTNGHSPQLVQVEPFTSFPVIQTKSFDITIANNVKQSDLFVFINNPILGAIDAKLEWIQQSANNICRASFKAPIVGSYLVTIELATNRPQPFKTEFHAKAYDLAKVLISCSERRCALKESFEFSVDASEAGEGQLEIAVNEGEIPNQVQVLDNGKCIVNFFPEESIPHVVDIKFNGHNVNGCPFVVEVDDNISHKSSNHQQTHDFPSQITSHKPPISGIPTLKKEERILVDTPAIFSLENIIDLVDQIDENDLQIIDPENQPVKYTAKKDIVANGFRFEFVPPVVGDYTIEVTPRSRLNNKLPTHLLEHFPCPLKVFDFRQVIVSDVTDGVIGHPIFFFIDASQAGSGNLEIKVSSKTRTVPNCPQSESNARIRVNFTPTEAVDHHIDVNFNGFPVPGNPFLVKVAQFPQARLPVTSQDVLKYVAINEEISFYVDYLGPREIGSRRVTGQMISENSCQVNILTPDLVYAKLNDIELLQPLDKSEKQPRFKINFKPTRIGPHKLFITVNNELLPSSPIVSNVYNINEVRVSFESIKRASQANGSTADKEVVRPVGTINQPVTFTVDASRAGEGTLALAVISSISQSLVQTDVKVSEKGHGLYNLTFVPTEFASHSIDMSFNDRVVPDSPFIVDILDSDGRSAIEHLKQQQTTTTATRQKPREDKDSYDLRPMVQNFESLNLKNGGNSPIGGKSKTPLTTASQIQQRTRKSLAYGLVNSSNVIYLESGVLENPKSQVSLYGPNDERVPFNLGKGSPQPGEPKKSFIEYEPKAIGKCVDSFFFFFFFFDTFKLLNHVRIVFYNFCSRLDRVR